MDTIEEIGYVTQNGIEFNTSAIFSRLIQEAGRWCESYASDILIDIETVKRILTRSPEDWHQVKEVTKTENGDISVILRFGFRKSGVDHAAWIEENLKDANRKYYYYRAIWNLNLTYTPKNNRVSVKLWRED